MIQTRSINDYFGRLQTATHPTKHIRVESFFTCLGEFDLYNDRLIVEFPDWTQESFINWGEVLGLFTKRYSLDFQQFADFYAANQSIIESIKETARTLCNAPETAQFRFMKLSVKDRRLEMSFYENEQDYPKNYYGTAYNDLIQADITASTPENPSLAETTIAKAYEIAFAKEPMYWNTTVAVTE